MAQGMGVPARHVARSEDFNAALKNAFEMHGPTLIEAIVPSEYEGLKLKALPHMLKELGSVPTPVAKAATRSQCLPTRGHCPKNVAEERG